MCEKHDSVMALCFKRRDSHECELDAEARSHGVWRGELVGHVEACLSTVSNRHRSQRGDLDDARIDLCQRKRENYSTNPCDFLRLA